jgi:hypothetical protein
VMATKTIAAATSPAKPKQPTRDELLQRVATVEAEKAQLRAECERIQRASTVESDTIRREIAKLFTAAPRESGIGYGRSFSSGDATETPSWLYLASRIGAVIAERDVLRAATQNDRGEAIVSGGDVLCRS